ncbi:MAG: tetratricopeptide repeat protein [Deltaproteobacteria bacterium]|nr:tetratricopeptide repeat protein [Deltaproteobacteria bacterium]
MTVTNFYKVLQVDPAASVEVIKGAYKVLLKSGHHPDLGGSTQVASLLNEAHQVLTNPKTRAEHDHALGLGGHGSGGHGSGSHGRGRHHEALAAETVFIVFCPACHGQNRLAHEEEILHAKCGHCHRRLQPNQDSPLGGEDDRVYRLGMYLFEKGLFERAQREFRQAVRLKPNHSTYRYWLARCLYEQKQPDKALVEIKAAMRLKPNAFHFHFWHGQILYGMKDFHHAADAFARAAELRPSHVPSFRRLGTCHYNLRQFPQAIEAFQRAVQADPKDSQSFRWLGIAHLSTNEYALALGAFQQAEALSPEDELTRRYIQLCQDQTAKG